MNRDMAEMCTGVFYLDQIWIEVLNNFMFRLGRVGNTLRRLENEIVLFLRSTFKYRLILNLLSKVNCSLSDCLILERYLLWYG